jgi:nucleotide-binding universal stress UspA family protein
VNGVVVVATDFSAVAAQALDEGRRLAGRLGVGVELLHVKEGFRGEQEWTPRAGDLAWLGRAGIAPEAVVVRSGTPWLEIVRYAQERKAEMVIVGTHGTTGFQPLTLGATAARLAILSPRPVVLVGAKTSNGGGGHG